MADEPLVHPRFEDVAESVVRDHSEVDAGSGTRGRGTSHDSQQLLDRPPSFADHALGPLIPEPTP